ncbi:MAG: leucyl aminopeptidase [Neomegalonema sp.]|nr:leucyl aminopeptidase [Neomegalonema sp.]
MTAALNIKTAEKDAAAIAAYEGALIGFYKPGDSAGAPVGAARALDEAAAGQLSRALAEAADALGETVVIRAPHGAKAEFIAMICVGATPVDAAGARKLGAAAAKAIATAKSNAASADLAEIFEPAKAAELAAEFAFGAQLRAYKFDNHKSEPDQQGATSLEISGVDAADALEKALGLAEGVLMARDLVNEPANILTPETFADRIQALGAAKGKAAVPGLKVEILDEAAMAKLGMNALLAVGQGSRKASALAIMRYEGAADPKTAPIAFVGKGVCFDTGGVSLKPAAGMEEMTMDMGGAATVVGAMIALARRKAPVNVVGVVGLVENMPDGDAQRPGDVVTAMSGKTIEVINTDAEGRLVLADALWHTQTAFKPRAVIDLATLTGAAIIALGHHNAALLANDDALAASLLSAAEAEGEGLWRLPLAKEYDRQLKSRIADMKNVGGRPAGTITAAQFLQRFVQDGVAWAHIDIAGVALVKEPTPLAPKGATGWGVATLVRYAETVD